MQYYVVESLKDLRYPEGLGNGARASGKPRRRAKERHTCEFSYLPPALSRSRARRSDERRKERQSELLSFRSADPDWPRPGSQRVPSERHRGARPRRLHCSQPDRRRCPGIGRLSPSVGEETTRTPLLTLVAITTARPRSGDVRARHRERPQVFSLCHTITLSAPAGHLESRALTPLPLSPPGPPVT